MSSVATGTVPSALRSGGQCALESPMSWLRVARTCPQSAARTTGRAAIDRVVERMNGREADGLQSYLLKFRNLTRAKRQLYQLQLYCAAGNSYVRIPTRVYSCKKKNAFSRAAKPLRRPKCRCGGAAPALSLITTTPTLLHSKVGPIFCYYESNLEADSWAYLLLRRREPSQRRRKPEGIETQVFRDST